MYDAERDREAKFRFGVDTDATARLYLAHARWILGEVARTQELADEAFVRAVDTNHVPTLANVCHFKSMFEICQGNARAVQRTSGNLLELSREHGLTLYLLWAALSSNWSAARLGEQRAGTTEFRRLLAEYVEQGNKLHLPLFQGLLAEVDAEGADNGAERALTGIDGAIALTAETGEHLSDAFLHRIRGEVLLKRDPANPAPAEDAFLVAIAIAQQQKATSFELRAAFSLARLYQSTGRPAGAHAVLIRALEGFSPTPEFPEIAEAQMLLATLA